MTDAELVARAQVGDAAAWQQLYHRVVKTVWRDVHAQVGSEICTDEITSDVLTTLVHNLASLDPDACKLNGWLRSVTRSRVADWARQKERQRRLLNGAQKQLSVQEEDPAYAACIASEQRTRVRNLIDGLRDDYQFVLRSKYIDNCSVTLIAQRMGVTEKAVESILYRARREFRTRFQTMVQQSEHPAGCFPSTLESDMPSE